MTRKKLQWGMIALAVLSVAAMTGAQIPAVSGPRSHAGADSTVYSPTLPPPTPQPTFRGGEATEPQPSPPT